MNMSTQAKTTKAAGAARRHPHDRSKMRFEGKSYGKGRMVLAVVQSYAKKHPHLTASELRAQFPDELHSLGVVQPVRVAKAKSRKHRRFFLRDSEVIKLRDRTVAVCSDFGATNIDKFLERARTLGYRWSRISA